MRVDALFADRVAALGRLGVLMMIGLLVFTALRPFDSVEWLIDNGDPKVVLSALTMPFYPSAMPLLFLLGGVSAWFAGMRDDVRGFARERVVRLGLPIVVGLVVFVPVQAWVVATHNGSYSGSLAGFIPTWLAGLPLSASPSVFEYWGGHLWFLCFLLVYALLSWPLQRWMRGAGQRSVRLLAELVTHHRGSIVLGVVPLVVARQGVQAFSPEVYGWTDFAYYAIFFVYGLLLLQDSRFAMVILRDWRWGAGAAAFGLVAIVLGGATGLLSESSLSPTVGPDLGAVVVNLALPLAAYGTAVVALAAALRWMAGPTPLLWYGQSVILAFYVVYQPVVVGVAAYVVSTELGYMSGLVATVALSLVATLVLVEVIRRVRPLRTVMSVTPYVRTPDAMWVPGKTPLVSVDR